MKNGYYQNGKKIDEKERKKDMKVNGENMERDNKNGYQAYDDFENFWEEFTNEQGVTYYYNSKTKETSWELPSKFVSLKKHLETGKQWYWIRDDATCFAPAFQVPGTTNLFETIDGRRTNIEKNQIVSEIHRIKDIEKDIDDMVMMRDIGEATVLHNIILRSHRNEYFTNVGTILVSVNPFKWIESLYSKSKFNSYRHSVIGDDLAPHFFEISEAAYRGLLDNGKSQSIIISGESGAGKTEATKKCLKYLADAAGSGSGLETKLLAANPILEAFGNAKTLRNGNSSRFGKWTTVYFNDHAKICGGKIENYLLEKSRVVIQMAGERNYHIFYQLLSGLGTEQRRDFHLPNSINDFEYLSHSGSHTVEGIDDSAEFQVIMQAFQDLDFTPQEQYDILRLCSGILLLGNIKFANSEGGNHDDPCRLESIQVAHQVGELLGFQTDDLVGNIMHHIRSMGGQTINSPLTAAGAKESCASLARELYGQLFNWLVSRVNDTLKLDHTHEASNATKIIGALDIFGFEIFENNSFEQLCINFTNEKLQQHFNNHTFKTEQEVYNRERIEFVAPKFYDNTEVLDLIEKRPRGLLVLLDEECVLPRGSDSSYLNKISKFYDQHPRFTSNVKGKRGVFCVIHYAGTVMYQTTGFVEKNKDEMRDNLRQLLSRTTFPLLEEIVQYETLLKRKHKSQSGFLRLQLDDLMQVLNATEPHYIRCIKPNAKKLPNLFDPFLILEQLQYSGIFETIQIRKQGFPFRRSHRQFYFRYRCLVNNMGSTSDFKANCEKILSQVSVIMKANYHAMFDVESLEAARIGVSMVLYRASEHFALEFLLEKVKQKACYLMVRIARGFLIRSRVRRFKTSVRTMQAAIASRNEDLVAKLVEDLEAASALPISVDKYLKPARSFLEQLREEKYVCTEIEALTRILVSNNVISMYEKVEEMLEKSSKLNLVQNYPKFAATLRDFREKIDSVQEFVDARKDLKQGIEMADEKALLSAIKKAEALTATHGEFCARDIQEAKDTVEDLHKEAAVVHALSIAILQCKCIPDENNDIFIDTQAHTRLEEAIRDISTQKHLRLTRRGLCTKQYAVLLSDLLHQVRASDWDAVAESLPKIEALQPALMRFQVPYESNFSVCRSALYVKVILNMLIGAVLKGRIGGNAATLDLSRMDVTDLKLNIANAKRIECTDLVVISAIEAANTLVELREEAAREFENGWNYCNARCETLKKLSEGPGTSDLILHCKTEVDLIRRSCFHHQVLELGRRVLETNPVQGIVGKLLYSEASIEELDKVIYLLSTELATESTNQGTAQLLELLTGVKTLRTPNHTISLSLVKSCMQLSRAFTINNSQEMLLLFRHETEMACIAHLEHCLQLSPIGGVVGALKVDVQVINELQEILERVLVALNDADMINGLISDYGNELYGIVQEFVKLRAAVVADQWEMVSNILEGDEGSLSGYQPIEGEYNLIVDEFNNRTIIAELTNSLKTGCLSGPLGSLDKEAVNCIKLDSDIMDAKALGCKSHEAKSLMDIAELVLGMRKSLVSDDWETLERLVDQIRFKKILPVAQTECERATKELHNHQIIHHLRKAFFQGVTIQNLRVSDITFHMLDEALELAQKLKCNTKEAQHLFEAGKLVRKGRSCLSESRFLQMGTLVEDAERSGFLEPNAMDVADDVPVSMIHTKAAYDELVLIRNVYIDESMKHDMLAALAEGKVSGRIGKLDFSSVKVQGLLQALTKHEIHEPLTVRARQIMVCANLMVSLREALVSGPDWELLEEVVNQSLTSEQMINTYGFDIIPEVQDEIAIVRDEVENRHIEKNLEVGIRKGSIRGVPGALDISNLSIDDLKTGIEYATARKIKVPEVAALLVNAKFLLELRQVVSVMGSTSESTWVNEVEAILEKDVNIVVPLVSEERKLVQNHIDDIRIVEALRQALATGMMKGSIGSADPSSCDFERLESGIQAAQTLICRTERAKKLLKTCQLVLEIRKMLKHGGISDSLYDFFEKRLAVSIFGGTSPDSWGGLADEAAVEIQQVIDECRDHYARESLTKFLQQGRISGSPGNIEYSLIEFEELEKRASFAIRNQHALATSTLDLTMLCLSIAILRCSLIQDRDLEDEVATMEMELTKFSSYDAFGSIKIDSDTKSELQLAKIYVIDFRVMERASSAIDPSSWDPDIIKTAKRAIMALNPKFGSRLSTESVAILDLLLKIRTAYQAGDGVALQQVIEQANESNIEIDLIPAAETQINETNRLILNYKILASLQDNIMHGGFVENFKGEIDRIPWKKLSTERLESALASCNTMAEEAILPQVQRAIELCRYSYELRNSLIAARDDNNHGIFHAIQRIYKEMTVLLERSSDMDLHRGICRIDDLESQIQLESDIVLTIAADFRIREELLNAMREGTLTGTVGDISISLLELEPLASKISEASQLLTLSKKTARILHAAKMHLRVRQHVLNDDWPSVLVVAESMLKAYSIDEMTAEMTLALEESRRMVAKDVLNAGLAHGAIVGSPGELVTHNVSVTVLTRSISRAMEIGIFCEEVEDLVLVADIVKTVRLGLLSKSKDGKGLLDCEQVRKAMSEYDIHKAHVAGCGRTFAINQELELVNKQLKDEELSSLMTFALRRDGIEELDRILLEVDDSLCHTVLTRALLKMTRMTRALRHCLESKDWTGADRLLTQFNVISNRTTEEHDCVNSVHASTSTMHWRAALSIVRPEWNAAYELVGNTMASNALRQALANDNPLIPVVHKWEHRCHSEEATLLLRVARLLIKVQRAEEDEDYHMVAMILHEATQWMGPLEMFEPCGMELRTIYVTAQNKVARYRLLDALETSSATLRIPQVILTKHVAPLMFALDTVKHIESVDDETLALIRSVTCLARLRKLFTDGNTAGRWEHACQIFAGCQDYALEAIKSSSTHSRRSVELTEQPRDFEWCHEATRDDIEFLMDYIEYQDVMSRLHAALQNGSAKFFGGFVDVSQVATGELKEAITAGQKLFRSSDEMDELLDSAALVLQCREALLDGSWQRLESLLEINVVDSEITVHARAADEIHHIRREVHLHRVVRGILEDLHRAAHNRDTEQLRECLKNAEHLRLENSQDLHVRSRVMKCQQLLKRLESVESRLRTGLRTHDLEVLDNALQEANLLRLDSPQKSGGSRTVMQARAMQTQLRQMIRIAEQAISSLDFHTIQGLLLDQRRLSVPRLPHPLIETMRALLSNRPHVFRS